MRLFALVFPFIYVCVDAFMGCRCNDGYIDIGQGRCIHGHCIYTWTHTRDLCNHICIYTDTYVYQYIIPRRVITIIYPGENSAKSKALTCACARARAGVCAYAGEIVNKL